ncbi:MAG: ATP-binding protein, partial [Bacteroidales bacterium]|nr:ATP-binding protein [Bacteroidales bacterium]
MAKIKIENFGPITQGCTTNDGWIEIRKNTFLIGNQGSGKSTVAKIFSILSWMEKSINRGDLKVKSISASKFIDFFKYQRIDKYFTNNTYIAYKGNRYEITYKSNTTPPTITKINEEYVVPKIMYVPSERNFLSTISEAYNTKGLPDNVFTFAEELKKAQKSTSGKKLDLLIGNYKYEYDEDNDASFIIGQDYTLNLLEASSGLQSFTPLYIVSNYLSNLITNQEESLRKNMSVTQSIRMDNEIAELMLNNSLTNKAKQSEIDSIRKRYYNKCFVNIVEEPEQNLFPNSQWQMLKALVAINNKNQDNRLLITTHSPYLINYLSILVKAYQVHNKITSEKSKEELNKIIVSESTINPKELIIYELNEAFGTIDLLDNYKGLPSDENFLNSKLG